MSATFATRTAQEGIDLASLAGILGHSGLRAVMKYVHPTPERCEEATFQLEAYNRKKAEELNANRRVQ